MQQLKLLVCVAFHYDENRVKYLKKVIDAISEYSIEHFICVNTNSKSTLDIEFLKKHNIEVVVHERLGHPYHLTHCHRSYMFNRLDDYDWFMYVEDDMVLPSENFDRFLEKFNELWPNYIPGFVRIEKYDFEEHTEFTPDIMIPVVNDMIVEVKDKKYVKLPHHYNYHAFWILSKEAIKNCIVDKGSKIFLSKPTAPEFREHCASFVIWTLDVPSLLSLDENNKLDRSCISYHTANNYRYSAKRISDIWQIH